MQDDKPLKEEAIDLVANNHMFAPEIVNKRLAELVDSFRMPGWVLDNGNRCCTQCGKPLAKSSVREIGLCLNAQNIGDIQVEILCPECKSGYFLLFRKACSGFHEFARLVDPDDRQECQSTPIPMHALTGKDNNLVDVLVEEDRKKKGVSQCP